MNASLIQLMQIRQYRFWILCPKHNNPTPCKRHIHLLPIERIIPHAIPLFQAVEEPLRVKGRDIRGAAGGDDDGGGGFDTFSRIYNDRQFINHDISTIIILLASPFYNYYLLTKELHLDF